MRTGKKKPVKRENGEFKTFIKKRWFWLFFPIAVIYMEIVLKIADYQNPLNIGLFFMTLFSLSIGFLLTMLCTLFSQKTNLRIARFISIFLWIWFSTQAVYHTIFKTFMVIYSIQGGGDAITNFWKAALNGIWRTSPVIILLFVPSLLLILFGKKFLLPRKTNWRFSLLNAGASAVFYGLAVLIVFSSDTGDISSKFMYFDSFNPDLTVNRFGLLTTTRLDLKHTLFGFEAQAPDDDPRDTSSASSGSTAPTQTGYEDQVMDIDWASLIANEKDENLLKMHQYFSSLTPTKTNGYTGLFKGKNLILITAESFSPYAIDPVLTPTLYKMQQQGFNFTDFYTPGWTVSTSDGEYVANVGLIPKSGVWSYYRSADNFMAFSMACQFRQLGYCAYGYHNNTYTFYKRNLTLPNMGYIYKGLGNGLQVERSWPESDLEMMEKSVDEYINQQPFHVFYMTVSGHMDYTYYDNAMATKNRQTVEDYYGDSVSLQVKAYHACNIELDKAMEYLLKRLNEAGIAENTVIAISPDHYPYGLTDEQMDELSGKTLEKTFELYKGIFLLYCQGQQPVTVDKLSCSMDIIPTLSNLFGLDYDSRLLMGYDIFSDTPGLVIFSNYSWLTDKGVFNAKTQTFTPNPGMTVDENYVSAMSKIVSRKFIYSTKILDYDYYRVIFGADKTSAVNPIPGNDDN
ncbi:MAG TPA: sulfatase-like hydrolase/transferase [Oscillospiraceae bacterium]|nr:sulfatase-like hydrolase/transferase [Oscillospiraceae bacterium]HPS34075.1 sulfatase-like hydrolase/transferase [Oscillospiraceae bacterium]